LKDRFVFASEIKALTPFFSELKNLDKAALDRYLTYLWCPGEGTPLQVVRKLLPGHAMWVNAGQIERSWRWYVLPVARPNSLMGRFKKASILNETIDHLRNAVHRQLVSDVPVGAFLSGGLDSSSVVAFARERNPDIRCFTIATTGNATEGMSDDLPYAIQVAKHLNVPLEVVRVDPMQMALDLPSMVAQLDEPLADPAPLNVLYISRLARQQGFRVLLSGAGGDDLFTGYRRHAALITERYWNWMPSSVLSLVEAGTHYLSASNPFGRRLRKLFSGAALKGDARLVNYFRWVNRSELMALYTPEFHAAVSAGRPEAPMLDFLKELPAATHPLERLLALEQRFFLTDHNLIYTDKMSMAAGVEVRVPFLDLELVEFAAQIPAHYKHGAILATKCHLSNQIGFWCPITPVASSGIARLASRHLVTRKVEKTRAVQPGSSESINSG
jgi:asparagine synthase (glutamine-hydrolysing)